MPKRPLSQRSRLIIELRHARGISATSIAGELGTTVERVQPYIDRLEARAKAKEHFGEREYELRGQYYVRGK